MTATPERMPEGGYTRVDVALTGGINPGVITVCGLRGDAIEPISLHLGPACVPLTEQSALLLIRALQLAVDRRRQVIGAAETGMP
jgi:hypothetical protein